MKLVKKVLAGVAVAAAMATSSHAALNSVGGVTWDPSVALDFAVNSAATFQQLDGTLAPSGFGTVTLINGLSTFCSGCELTFTFSGFTTAVSSYNLITDSTTVGFTGGTFQFFVDYSNDTNGGTTLNSTTAGNGTPWLTLTAHAKPNSLTLVGTFDGANPALATLFTGNGFLDATGGPAAVFLNSNSQGFGSDLLFSSSFNKQVTPEPGFVAAQYGTSSLSGDSLQIPEPGSLALVGLGLLGLAAARRRKSA